MIIKTNISGMVVFEVAHITKEGRHAMREKYSQLGYKFKNVGDNAVINYEDVEAENMHLLEDIKTELFKYLKNPK